MVVVVVNWYHDQSSLLGIDIVVQYSPLPSSPLLSSYSLRSMQHPQSNATLSLPNPDCDNWGVSVPPLSMHYSEMVDVCNWRLR